MRRFLAGIMLGICYSSHALTAPLSMTTGTWALEAQPDPFAQSYPVLAYLPAGTIVFDTAEGTYNSDHILALTQHGFWVQIRRNGKGGPVLKPITDLGLQIPSKAVFFHQSLLCLSETNIIIDPDERCQVGVRKDPVGEGWLFQYEESDRPNWIHMTAVLDSDTQNQLKERGWDLSEGSFEMKLDDLNRLEQLGHVTTLNRDYPVVSIYNQGITPVLIGCGRTTVTTDELKAGVSAEASAEAQASFFSWLSAKLSIKASTSAEAKILYSDNRYL